MNKNESKPSNTSESVTVVIGPSGVVNRVETKNKFRPASVGERRRAIRSFKESK